MANPFDLLTAPPAPPQPGPSFRFGTVTGTSPLRVRLDGDPDPTPSEPVRLCDVSVGDRVQVNIYNRRMVITGVVNGNREYRLETSTGHEFRMTSGGYIDHIVSGKTVWTVKPDGVLATGQVPLANLRILELGSSENFNSLTDPGLYYQSANAEASTSRNYPVPLAGLLEVYRGPSATDYVHQRYWTYNNSGTWRRTKYQSTWYDWIPDDADVTSLFTKPSGSYVTEWNARQTGKTVTAMLRMSGGWAGGMWAVSTLLNIDSKVRPVRAASVSMPYHSNVIVAADPAGTLVMSSSGGGMAGGTYTPTITWGIA